MPPSLTKTQVVIVGAGASGLQCASILKQRGIECIILEARDRIGGRIHSQALKRTTTDGTTVELTVDHGAAWIHGLGYDWPTGKKEIPRFQPNPMMSLLIQHVGMDAAFSQHLQPVFQGNPWTRPKFALYDTEQIVFYKGGKKLAKCSNSILKALKRNNDIINRVEAIGFELQDADGNNNIDTSAQDIMNQVKAEPEFFTLDKDLELVTGFYQHLYECWSAASASDLQVGEYMGNEKPSTDNIDNNDHNDDDDDEISDKYESNGDYSGPHCNLLNGIKTLLDPLLENGVQDCVLLCQEVTRIGQQLDGGIVVDTNTGFRIEADACVITIPISCLRKATDPENKSPLFQTKLSNEKLEAIEKIRAGPYKKIFLTFSKTFWSDNLGFIGLLNDSGTGPLGKYLLVDNLWANRGIPCMEVILLNEQADWATHKPTDEIVHEVLLTMEAVMGKEGLKELLVDSHVTRWEEDPFSLGAYSCLRVGASEVDKIALRALEWEGKLSFCGEATVSDHEGSVHAALLSGIRSANEMCELFPHIAA